jgi:hypothetical protein
MFEHPKRSVQFRSTIEILEFAYTIGDNPSVPSGVPLSMEWTLQARTILPLCAFEMHRPPARSRECGPPRRISSRRREELLWRNGCSINDMIAAARDVLRIQKERAFTQYQLQTQRLMYSRRQRVIHQEPATAPSSPPIIIISVRKKPRSADRSPILPQRRTSLVTHSSATIELPPSSPATVSPRAADKEKVSSPLVLSSPTNVATTLFHKNDCTSRKCIY